MTGCCPAELPLRDAGRPFGDPADAPLGRIEDIAQGVVSISHLPRRIFLTIREANDGKSAACLGTVARDPM